MVLSRPSRQGPCGPRGVRDIGMNPQGNREASPSSSVINAE